MQSFTCRNRNLIKWHMLVTLRDQRVALTMFTIPYMRRPVKEMCGGPAYKLFKNLLQFRSHPSIRRCSAICRIDQDIIAGSARILCHISHTLEVTAFVNICGFKKKMFKVIGCILKLTCFLICRYKVEE